MGKTNELLTTVFGRQTLSAKGAETLYDFLTGVPDDAFTFRKQPEMEPSQALATVYFIERRLSVTPSAFTVLDDANDLYLWLQNNYYDPDMPYFITKFQPGLSAEEAFAVIYYLQEKFQIISETYEQCDMCGRLYDSEEEGILVDDTGKHYCNDCIKA